VGRALIANADWPQRVKNGETQQLRVFAKDMLERLE